MAEEKRRPRRQNKAQGPEEWEEDFKKGRSALGGKTTGAKIYKTWDQRQL